MGFARLFIELERLYRTQEVGGLKPPSSIDSKLRQEPGAASGGSPRTRRLARLKRLGAGADDGTSAPAKGILSDDPSRAAPRPPTDQQAAAGATGSAAV